jgi:hypothetical protein
MITGFLFISISLVIDVSYSGEQRVAQQLDIDDVIVLAQSSAPGGFVACPTRTTTVGVYRVSPADWSQPRHTARLQNTAIITVAGRKTLQCVYRTVGDERDSFITGEFSILREYPAGVSDCTPAEGGFMCR